MVTILLPIKPKYANKILNGEKDIEFRKSFPKESVDKIVIYATAPVSRVVGEVEVVGQIQSTIDFLKNGTNLYDFLTTVLQNKVGISKKDFEKYYKDKYFAYYYKLGEVTKYDKSLKDLNIDYAPQNFVYLNQGEK